MAHENNHEDCDCESFIPRKLIAAIISVMVFQSVVVVVILGWTSTRWMVSPADVKEQNTKETREIKKVLSEMEEKIDWLIVEEKSNS